MTAGKGASLPPVRQTALKPAGGRDEDQRTTGARCSEKLRPAPSVWTSREIGTVGPENLIKRACRAGLSGALGALGNANQLNKALSSREPPQPIGRGPCRLNTNCAPLSPAASVLRWHLACNEPVQGVWRAGSRLPSLPACQTTIDGLLLAWERFPGIGLCGFSAESCGLNRRPWQRGRWRLIPGLCCLERSLCLWFSLPVRLTAPRSIGHSITQ